MKNLLFVIALLLPLSVLAEQPECTPGTAQKCKPRAKPQPTTINSAASTAYSQTNNANNNVNNVAVLNNTQPANNSNTTVVNQAESRTAAYAPDVVSYPTAPCQASFGVSAGWFGGSGGIGGSMEVESCAIVTLSTGMYNQGARDAAMQMYCLDSRSRMALEATGFKCLIAKNAPIQQERITP